MRNLWLFLILTFSLASLTSFQQCFGQENGFEFGQMTFRELGMKTYDRDSTADALVLDEFGEAWIESTGDFNLIFHYHVKIKILKKSGLEKANYEIPLYRQDSERAERLRSIRASSFNIENGRIRESKLDEKNVFTQNRGKNLNVKKFAIPNVREGSVIEVEYQLESPFIFKFRPWEFQSDIPKLNSEFWAHIPANYMYNITLRGFLKLQKNENSIVHDCFTPGSNKADCSLLKYGMKDIPAFIEEDFMTARSNYVSAINFELSEIKYFDGHTNKISKEWKDAEMELRRHENFGIQIKRGKDIVDTHIKVITAGVTDPLEKTKKIYDFIKGWYRWDESYGKYSDGIKKAFDQKTGNTGDINLSLIAALKYAEIEVEPVILSTRDNGLPIELHPVISDFNYVIAKVNIGEKYYLLDATDDFLPFGLIPERCLNGKGRVLGSEESYWIELKPGDKRKQYNLLNLKLENDGVIRGTIQNTYMGYEAMMKRKNISAFSTVEEYIEDLDNKLDGIEIKNFEFTFKDDIDKPIVQKLGVEIQVFDHASTNNFLFNPFILDKWKENPFKSRERLYPVDFGAPMEITMSMQLEYPSEFEIVNIPAKVGLSLPNAGGRYIFEAADDGHVLKLNNSVSIGKTVFTSLEYHYLKELFNNIVLVQNTELLFKRKP